VACELTKGTLPKFLAHVRRQSRNAETKGFANTGPLQHSANGYLSYANSCSIDLLNVMAVTSISPRLRGLTDCQANEA
jgi:hypothetical protein